MSFTEILLDTYELENKHTWNDCLCTLVLDWYGCTFLRFSISICKTSIRSSRSAISWLRDADEVGLPSWLTAMTRSSEIVFNWYLFVSHWPVRCAKLMNEINESRSHLRSMFSWASFHFSSSQTTFEQEMHSRDTHPTNTYAWSFRQIGEWTMVLR